MLWPAASTRTSALHYIPCIFHDLIKLWLFKKKKEKRKRKRVTVLFLMAFKKRRTEFRPILSGTALKASQMVKQEITCITTVNLPVHWTSLEHSSKLKLATKSNHILHLTLESQENPRKSGVRNLGRTSLQVICVLTTRNPGKRQPCTGVCVSMQSFTTKNKNVSTRAS